MFRRLPLAIAAIAAFPVWLPAQEKDEPPPIRFRAVLHDPVNPVANLFYRDPEGAIVPVNLRPQALTETMSSLPVNGSLVLYDSPVIDPENPSESVAASVRMAAGVRQVIVVILPAPDDVKPPYRMLVVDDSKAAFREGESKVIPLIGVEVGLQAGEHALRVHPGKIATLPPVRKVNEFNMAQTNFHYRRDDDWVVFTERQLQYIDACRRIFIIHATPGALAPSVTTIVDTARPR